MDDSSFSDAVTPCSGEADEARPHTVALSILVVGYNSADLIGRCLGSIPAAVSRHDYEVLLVDNGDGSTEALVARDFPAVRIIPSRGNIGFAGGNNLLAAAARGDFLLLLNPDMVLFPGAIDALFDGVSAHPEAGAWGGVTLDERGEPDAGNTIPMPSLREFASTAMGRSLAHVSPSHSFTHDERVPALMGGFVMFARTAWDRAGGLDDRFFLYCEEVDLFYRLSALGYSFWRIAAARGHHAVGHGNQFAPMRLLYRAAGTMEFVRRHWPMPKRILAFGLMWAGASARFGAGMILGAKRSHLRDLREGYRLVALRPHYWAFGYHPKSGLKAKLARQSGRAA